MRMLLKNKRTIYYALYTGKTENVDSYGNKTGEYVENYSAPIELKINVSAARGSLDLEQFGINTQYTKTMVTDDLNCPIDEESILWIDRVPDSNGEAGSVKHNYAVVQVAKSLNQITYAIKEVSVS